VGNSAVPMGLGSPLPNLTQGLRPGLNYAAASRLDVSGLQFTISPESAFLRTLGGDRMNDWSLTRTQP